MDYKKMAIEDLKKHEQRKQSIKSIKEKIMALEYDKISLGGMSDSDPVQTSDTNKQENKLVNIISEQRRLKQQLQAVTKFVDRLEGGLNRLEETERKVLDLFYINSQKGYMWRLQDELGYEKSRIYQIKDKALYNLTITLYGILDL